MTGDTFDADFQSCVEGGGRASRPSPILTKKAKPRRRRVAADASLFEAMGEATRDAIARAIKPLLARIEELESSAMHDEGVWRGGKSYRPGAVVSHAGAAWVCKGDGGDAPGKGPGWRLLFKTGGGK